MTCFYARRRLRLAPAASSGTAAAAATTAVHVAGSLSRHTNTSLGSAGRVSLAAARAKKLLLMLTGTLQLN